MSLKTVYKILKGHSSIRYRVNVQAYEPLDENNLLGEKVTVSEMLTIKGFQEGAEIVNFDSFNLISYGGRNAEQLRRTLAALRLPSSFNGDLGEKVFYTFASHLKTAGTGPVYIEQKVRTGKERQLVRVLDRLAQHYDNQAASTKRSLSGEELVRVLW